MNAFDRDLRAIQTMLETMGGMARAALVDAVGALEACDEDRADHVLRNDAAIDDLETGIHEAAARLIALRMPNASDLRTVLAVMKIAAALERCGDYAKNLAKRTKALAQLDPVGGPVGSVVRLSQAVGQLLADALDAFGRQDVALAQEVRQRDREVDQMYSALFRELLTHMMEDPRSLTALMHLHFIAKNIERVGDHATAIAEQTIYLVTGSLPDDARPKQDLSSS